MRLAAEGANKVAEAYAPKKPDSKAQAEAPGSQTPALIEKIKNSCQNPGTEDAKEPLQPQAEYDDSQAAIQGTEETVDQKANNYDTSDAWSHEAAYSMDNGQEALDDDESVAWSRQADLEEEVVFRPRLRQRTRAVPSSGIGSNETGIWMAPYHGQATDKKPSKENSLADWDGTFLPAPLGNDWELRDPYDPINNRHFLRIIKWIFSDPAAFTMETGINLRSDAFKKGYGEIIDDKTVWRPLDEENIHDTFPHLTTVNHPRRDEDGDVQMKEFLGIHGTTPECVYVGEVKWDQYTGEWKSLASF